MAPPVNKPGHPPDVTVLIVSKETDVIRAWKDPREKIVMNAPRTTMEMNAVIIFTLH